MPTIRVTAAIIKSYTPDNQPIIFATQRGYGDFAGGWEFPGGKIEDGETHEEALKREIQEEMELEIDIIGHFDDVKYVYPDFILKMYCYKCRTNDLEFKLNVHKDFKWLRREELKSIDWAPADCPIVKRLMEEK